MFKGFGLLHKTDFAEIDAVRLWSIRDGYAEGKFGSKVIRVPTRPFCGEIGVARREDGAHSASTSLPLSLSLSPCAIPSTVRNELRSRSKSVPPYSTGGNIDTKHITAGTRIILPIAVPGALVSLGDGHALQGDGEVCGSAIETPVKVRVRLNLLPSSSLPYTIRQPQYTTPPELQVHELERDGFHTTMGIAPNYLEAAEMAVRYMIEYMCGVASEGGIRKEDAYMLCSVVGDLHACEVVDMPNYAVGFRMPE